MIVGEIFDGKYRIVDILGQGGMGTVYLARNIKLDTLWAIKKIRRNHGSAGDVLVEANILKKLNHPALPRIFDIIDTEDGIYIIADYIEGVSLDKELEKGAQFSEGQVVEWARQICDVLIYLHGVSPNPIIYRDMKPSNMILTPQGSLKLIDFGIAREYKKNSDSDTLYLGTRGYAAPEQYGTGQTSAASDIYSLGVTLHHLLTGKNPNTPPLDLKPVQQYNENLSEEVGRIIGKCTRFSPEERYSSAFELLQDLNSLQKGGYGETHFRDAALQAVSFKRLVLAIWNNPEFACELACAAAKLTGGRVLLINLDAGSPKVNFYLGIEETLRKRGEKEEVGLGKPRNEGEYKYRSSEALEEACIRLPDCSNLYILPDFGASEERGMNENSHVEKLIAAAYRHFDITLLIIVKNSWDRRIQTAFSAADYTVIAVRARMDELLEYQEELDRMEQEAGGSAEKVRLVAWEYKEGVHLPEKLLKKAFGGKSYIGKLEYSPEREKSKNLEGVFYARTAWKKHRDEYKQLLSNFGLIPEITWSESIRNKFQLHFGKTGRRKNADE